VKPYILDITAGNRHIWTDKNPLGTIFLDKEPNLKISPDIVADFSDLHMFEDNAFTLVVFDPPFAKCGNMHSDPQETYGSYWGSIDSTFELLKLVSKALIETHRVLRDDGFLFIKFNDVHTPLQDFLLVFKTHFNELIRTSRKTQSGKSDSQTYWILFQKKIQSSLSSVRNEY